MAEPRLPTDRASICSQLLRQLERGHDQIEQVRDEMSAPVYDVMLNHLRGHTASGVVEGIYDVLAKIEDTLRAIEYCQSEIHRELSAAAEHAELKGPENLPPRLTRFVLDRKNDPGFTYHLRQDPVRGWIVHWKVHTAKGTVRSAGNFYERPYAWLDD